MTVGEAAARLLKFLDMEDEEDYDTATAIEHINQAIFEVADETEVRGHNEFAYYALTAPDSGDEPDYWSVVPGRFLLSDVVGVSAAELGYIKRIWLSDGEGTLTFEPRDVRKLLEEEADETGVPSKFAVDGEYLYLRPVPVSGVSYYVRTYYNKLPASYGSGEQPHLLQVAPFAVIYRAAEIACLWNDDERGQLKFGKMAERAISRFSPRTGMSGTEGEIMMEDYNG